MQECHRQTGSSTTPLIDLPGINKIQPLRITTLAWCDATHADPQMQTYMHGCMAAGCTATSPSWSRYHVLCGNSKAPYITAWNGKVGQHPHWEQQIHTPLHSRTATLHSERAHRPCRQSFSCAWQTIVTHLLNVSSFLFIQHSLNQSAKQQMEENVSFQLANKDCEDPIIRSNSCIYRFWPEKHDFIYLFFC